MGTSVNIFRNTHSSSSSGGGKEEQTKSVTITENGTTTITPDEGKTLASVTVNTEVIGRGVYVEDPIEGSFYKIEGSSVDENLLIFRIPNSSAVYIVVTTDGEIPENDNILIAIDVVIGSMFDVEFNFEQEGIRYKAYIELYTPEPDR